VPGYQHVSFTRWVRVHLRVTVLTCIWTYNTSPTCVLCEFPWPAIPISFRLLSRTTIEWAKSHNFPSYSQAKMEDTRLENLTVKVGFPYLYCHQGDCEHLVIITDVRSVPLSSVSSHSGLWSGFFSKLIPTLTSECNNLEYYCHKLDRFYVMWLLVLGGYVRLWAELNTLKRKAQDRDLNFAQKIFKGIYKKMFYHSSKKKKPNSSQGFLSFFF